MLCTQRLLERTSKLCWQISYTRILAVKIQSTNYFEIRSKKKKKKKTTFANSEKLITAISDIECYSQVILSGYWVFPKMESTLRNHCSELERLPLNEFVQKILMGNIRHFNFFFPPQKTSEWNQEWFHMLHMLFGMVLSIREFASYAIPTTGNQSLVSPEQF